MTRPGVWDRAAALAEQAVRANGTAGGALAELMIAAAMMAKVSGFGFAFWESTSRRAFSVVRGSRRKLN